MVVWRLDRLGRSLKDLIDLVTKLDEEGVAFQSVQESIDTTSPGGKLVFHGSGWIACRNSTGPRVENAPRRDRSTVENHMKSPFSAWMYMVSPMTVGDDFTGSSVVKTPASLPSPAVIAKTFRSPDGTARVLTVAEPLC